ncbi:MAG: exodeoxyribonuclease VII large subunit [Candidatus Binataceae bacterium]
MGGQLQLSLRGEQRSALNVTQLVRMVREALEFHLDECWVVGEISNARVAPSNHFYFTLKDERCAINVVMFNSAYRRLRFKVNDGMEVVMRGRVSLYETRGTLQFYAEEMEPRGLGALQLAFEQLKRRLGQEGLFEQAHKRPLPFLPQTVGIVTALGGAGLRDMLTVMLARYPNLHVIIRPALVQGAGAAAQIAAAIDDLNRDGRAEVIIVGRGGGSIEDLWAFNEEVVARAIYGSAIPVVSAVGHEIDYSIADLAADKRAPTPTAAAQMVVPGKLELQASLDKTAAALADAILSALTTHRRQLGHLSVRLRDPANQVRQARQRLDEAAGELDAVIRFRLEDLRRLLRELGGRLRNPLAAARERRLIVGRLALRLGQVMAARTNPLRLMLGRAGARLGEPSFKRALAARRATVASDGTRLETAMAAALDTQRMELAALAGRLDSLSPLRVLERGYAVVINRRDGHPAVDAAGVEVGDELDITLNRGRLRARTIARES